MTTALPPWLTQLRRTEITNRVRDDPRSTQETLLGVDPLTAMQAINWGQAEFDEPWDGLSPDDRVLLYAYLNQLGHLEELTAAFRMLFMETPPEGKPIVVDLGCGPFTGGLALAGVLTASCDFDYIGMDRSHAMRRFGERLAAAATSLDVLPRIVRHWTTDLPSVSWETAPGWDPVIVIVSYLLASPTLDATKLMDELEGLLTKLGRGPVTVLYTNSPRPDANRGFPAFRDALLHADFSLRADDRGKIEIDRWTGMRERHLKYALFHRHRQNTLQLGDQ